MQRWQCPIYNGTLQTLIFKILSLHELKSRYFCEFPHCFLSARSAQVTFFEKPKMKINSWKEQKHAYLIYTWSDMDFKGTVVNRALPFLHEGSLKITLTVPLNNINQPSF